MRQRIGHRSSARRERHMRRGFCDVALGTGVGRFATPTREPSATTAPSRDEKAGLPVEQESNGSPPKPSHEPTLHDDD
jgi:hypothetical protein